MEICRKLDGIPLAIELAAARVSLFGVSGLAARFDDSLAVLTRSRRTALPRHKTLRATLDWSYGILSADEQTVLKRLAIFCGEFTLDSGTAVASGADIPCANVSELVAALVAKSLLVASLRNGIARYRLLDTTRAYAREKLLKRAEYHRVSRLHANTLCQSLQSVRTSSGRAVSAEQLTICKRMVDDVRDALRWCFSSDGDRDIGVSLTAPAAWLFMRLSLLDECRNHVERVLNDSGLVAMADPLVQLSLNLNRGHLLVHMARADSEVTNTFDRALEIAEKVGLFGARVEAIAGAWLGSTRCADHPRALELAQRYRREAAATGEMDELVYSRMMALPLHYMGQLADARRIIEPTLEHSLKSALAAHDRLFYIDIEVVMCAVLARNCWLQGFPDQASDAARRSLARAISINSASAICYSLVVAACPVAVWRGDLSEAARLTSMLEQCSANTRWSHGGPGYRSISGSFSSGEGAHKNHSRVTHSMQPRWIPSRSMRSLPCERAASRARRSRA